MSKTDARLHARTQLGHSEMQERWDDTFGDERAASGNVITLTCAICGHEYDAKVCELENGRHLTCWDPDRGCWRILRSIDAAIAHSHRALRSEPWAEAAVARELDRLGIEYVREHMVYDLTVGGTSFDFCLPQEGVALEVLGEYWHCDPRRHPRSATSEAQLRNEAAWARKSAIADAHGLQIITVWEIDITRNARAAVVRALAGGD